MVVTSWLPWMERPRSPVRACLSQIRYCTTNGSSRLYCSRIAARVSGDAWRDPTNARAGSPARVDHELGRCAVQDQALVELLGLTERRALVLRSVQDQRRGLRACDVRDGGAIHEQLQGPRIPVVAPEDELREGVVAREVTAQHVDDARDHDTGRETIRRADRPPRQVPAVARARDADPVR